ncbi:MAG: 23S rRNA (adenine(2503)-C(2))-methyltransferase RlmN [Candidatus Omnitrophica bacterium]|nr:23S rRNA (adenine(2503)-C(2))-methyltransferase RlmN [Candidatus Omnitrophota bacterium]
MQDLKNLSLTELKQQLQQWDIAAFHAAQLFSWIYKKGILDFSQMSDISVLVQKRLRENFIIQSSSLASKQLSVDGTEKFLFRLYDGNIIEAALIPAEGRVTGCVSSQVGCKFSCAFCASGIKGFKRNLSCAEIIDQVLFLKRASRGGLSHIVFMGTGEPFDNYDAVLKAIRIINTQEGLAIGARKITISTAGVIPGIRRLATEQLQVELSVSLHAADGVTRSQLMPINKKYPLLELLQACRDYVAQTNRQITFEYALIRGVNSSLKDAQKLSTIVAKIGLAKVNLIVANPVKELCLQPPTKLEVLSFQDFLKKHGVVVTLRRSRGKDIDAACGQLRLGYEKQHGL